MFIGYDMILDLLVLFWIIMEVNSETNSEIIETNKIIDK